MRQDGLRSPPWRRCPHPFDADRAAPLDAEPIDADLARIVAAWPTLPAPLKAAMLAMVAAEQSSRP
jgi:hypothetical protein